MIIPNKSSLWPSTPRNETWERSGSLRPASPPTSPARTATPQSKEIKAAVKANFVNLKLWDQAFLSQVRIEHPPFNSWPDSGRKIVCGKPAFHTNFRHTLSSTRCHQPLNEYSG